MTDAKTTPPDVCPDCGEVTHEVNISVNVSKRYDDEDGQGVQYVGDTVCGDFMPEIGTICWKCSREWLDDGLIREALIALELITEEVASTQSM